MSQDVRTTELESGEDTGAPAAPTDWLRIVAEFVRQDGSWALSDIAAAEPADSNACRRGARRQPDRDGRAG